MLKGIESQLQGSFKKGIDALEAGANVRRPQQG